MKTVLLIDDDPISNFITKISLRKSGLTGQINTVLNGKQAITFLNDNYLQSGSFPDIIFLDLDMPIMDGFAFLEAFRGLESPQKNNVNIVILTSSFNQNDVVKAKEMGIVDYLTKPLTEEKINILLKDKVS